MASLRAELTDGTLVVSGELDMANASLLWATICGSFERGADAPLDLSAVTFMDSTALSALLRAGDDYTIAIVASSPQVARILELTGTADVLTRV